MNKINYQNILLKTISKLTTRPKLLLHSCCAPCTSAVIESLVDHFDITLYFYNPNILPQEEYLLRLTCLQKFIIEFNLANNSQVKLVVPEYDQSQYFSTVADIKQEKEGGSRCQACLTLRLANSAKYASKYGFDYFCTTLTVSPYKNSTLINQLGITLGQENNVNFLCSDFAKNDGYKRSCELSKQYGLYRQHYCGCNLD
ncbi:MAG: epoxyqueuosine reductase QueH [Clostridia bacterium]